MQTNTNTKLNTESETQDFKIIAILTSVQENWKIGVYMQFCKTGTPTISTF